MRVLLEPELAAMAAASITDETLDADAGRARPDGGARGGARGLPRGRPRVPHGDLPGRRQPHPRPDHVLRPLAGHGQPADHQRGAGRAAPRHRATTRGSTRRSWRATRSARAAMRKHCGNYSTSAEKEQKQAGRRWPQARLRNRRIEDGRAMAAPTIPRSDGADRTGMRSRSAWPSRRATRRVPPGTRAAARVRSPRTRPLDGLRGRGISGSALRRMKTRSAVARLLVPPVATSPRRYASARSDARGVVMEENTGLVEAQVPRDERAGRCSVSPRAAAARPPRRRSTSRCPRRCSTRRPSCAAGRWGCSRRSCTRRPPTRRWTARCRRSRRPPAPRSATTWSPATPATWSRRWTPRCKAGTSRDLAFMSDRRFVGQLHNLGDLTDVTDVVEEMRKLYGEPATEATNYCVFDGRWFAIPYHFIGVGDVPAQGLVRRRRASRSSLTTRGRSCATTRWRSPTRRSGASAGASR